MNPGEGRVRSNVDNSLKNNDAQQASQTVTQVIGVVPITTSVSVEADGQKEKEASGSKGSNDLGQSGIPKQPDGSKSLGRPLITYAYSESASARENLEFFISQGLHDAADFIFILNGETDAASLIPERDNIQIISRPNKCFDLGAHGEVLRQDDLWKKYKSFITLNASIRGPFIPYWAQRCWSDVFLSRVTNEVKLVGMTANCLPQYHIQSMVWATDSIGMELLLYPPPGSSTPDKYGGANDMVALEGCYKNMHKAVHGEIGATGLIQKAGYKVDALMAAFHKSGDYQMDCEREPVEDILWDRKYYGANVHPYETIFMKANRDIDPTTVGLLTVWHLKGAFGGSWDICQ
ncbi:hypothetical protein SCUP515_02784 [Seiridium cupressi]